jgi:hypothetical protein
MWFDILKNEMRTINLPKFKVKPFDVNKPDEDKDDCKDRMLNGIWKKSEQARLIDDNPKGSPSSLFDSIDFDYVDILVKQVDDSKRFIQTSGPEHFVSTYWLYSFGPKITDNHARIDIMEYRLQDIESNGGRDIPEEVYCKALDIIAKRMPQKDEYIEKVGDGWQIYYHYTDEASGMLKDKYDKPILKRRVLQITGDDSRDQVLTIHNKAHVTMEIFRNKNDIENAGISAALDEIHNHFKDIKIEW